MRVVRRLTTRERYIQEVKWSWRFKRERDEIIDNKELVLKAINELL
jgi:hypothetical protein